MIPLYQASTVKPPQLHPCHTERMNDKINVTTATSSGDPFWKEPAPAGEHQTVPHNFFPSRDSFLLAPNSSLLDLSERAKAPFRCYDVYRCAAFSITVCGYVYMALQYNTAWYGNMIYAFYFYYLQRFFNRGHCCTAAQLHCTSAHTLCVFFFFTRPWPRNGNQSGPGRPSTGRTPCDTSS